MNNEFMDKLNLCAVLHEAYERMLLSDDGVSRMPDRDAYIIGGHAMRELLADKDAGDHGIGKTLRALEVVLKREYGIK